MAVTVIKKTVAQQNVKDLTEDVEFHALLTKMAKLELEMAPAKANLAVQALEYSDTEKTVLAIINEEGLQDKKYTFSISEGMIEISAVPKSTEVTDYEGMITALESAEEGLFRKLAKVTLGDLKKYLGENIILKYCKVSRKGKRRVKLTLEV